MVKPGHPDVQIAGIHSHRENLRLLYTNVAGIRHIVLKSESAGSLSPEAATDEVASHNSLPLFAKLTSITLQTEKSPSKMMSTPLNQTSAPATKASCSFSIGDRIVPSRYFLAPLAGYTHLAFRRAIRELGGLGLATTDLVHATQLCGGHRHSLELVETHDDDQPLSVQIFGGNVDQLAAAARWLEDHGYSGIDINMGCPMAKVNGQGGGARLLCDADLACRLVGKVVNAVKLPVTVKMRLGWDRDTISSPYLARRFEAEGVQGITIHGRTRQQGFQGSVDLDGIAATVAAVDRIPIIGNGDVRSVEDAVHMRCVTGCSAVAIGRGAMLDPWIFRKLEDHEQGRVPREPSRDEQIRFLVRHFSLMTEQHADRSCFLFRKFAAWYGERLGIPDDLENRLRKFASVTEFDEIVAEVRIRHGERQSKMPTALIKVPNGPVERW
ncbi:tRNA dihydrouridine synthase [Schlesneria sp. DSM 10557]|uniref:tRNA dihydrouridine synthase n=1 Tax=Schlesneria sp. DSM 10557 TaxID=3044399 RepID=UPI0035A0726C